jgi:hypothetical protein
MAPLAAPVPVTWLPDEGERDVVDREIDHSSHLADVEDVRRPLVQLVDFDEADIEIDVDVATGPAGVERRESQARQLLRRAGSDTLQRSAEARVYNFARFARHMAVSEGVHRVAVADETGDGGGILSALHIGDHRGAAAEVVKRLPRLKGANFISLLLRRLDDANRHASSVRQIKGLRHERASRLRQFCGSLPFLHEDQDGGPRVGPDFRILERPRVGSMNLAFALLVRPTIVLTDAVPADGCRHHIAMLHEVDVVLIACIQQITQGELVIAVRRAISGEFHFLLLK